MVSGPVRRNFSGNGPSSQRKKGGVVRYFFLALVALVIALSTLAIRLSRQVIQQSSTRHHSHLASPGMGDAPVKAVVSSGAADVAPPSKKIIPSDDGKHRVYCMVPFIWNEEIYNAIMETWGTRCDVINFLTDAIVGGKLVGDKITDDPSVGYKNYTDFPPGTFPDNVIFINMTRPWTGCTDRKSGRPKLCRHIWEKM